jgi:hypothetical protein
MCNDIVPHHTNVRIPVGLNAILRQDVSALILIFSKNKYLLIMRERTSSERKFVWTTKFCTWEPTFQHNYCSAFLKYKTFTCTEHKALGNFMLAHTAY